MRNIGILALLMLVAAPRLAGDEWSFGVTPYLWLPTLNGTLRQELPPDSGEGDVDVEIGPNDYLANLNAVAMVSAEARKGRLSFGGDLIYLGLSSERSNIRRVDSGEDTIPIGRETNLDTNTALEGAVWTLTAGWLLSSDRESPVDVFVGVRRFAADSDTDFILTTTITGPNGSRLIESTGRASAEVDLWDGIIGIRGRAKMGARWRVPYSIDAGAGSSDLTWQATAGVAYAFGWGDVGVVYRHLAYDEGDDGVLQDFSLSGPAVAFAFRF